MKKIFNKENIILLIIIFLIAVIMCYGYVKGHYSVDDYNIIDIGYKEYSINNNLKEGRVVMYVIDQIALLLNMDYKLFIILTVLIAIFITSVTIIIFYNEVLKTMKQVDLKDRIFVACISFVIFFNFMYIENLYFVECIVMSLALILYLVSAILFVKRKNIVLSIILAILANICYNGMQCYYIIIVFLFSLLLEKDKYKKIILNVLLAGLIIILAVLINVLEIKLACNIFNIENKRMGSIEFIPYNIYIIIKRLPIILARTAGLFPKYVYLFFITICYIILFLHLLKKKDYKVLIDITLNNFITILSCFCISIFSTSSFGTGRLLYGMGMTIGTMLLILYDYIRRTESHKVKYIIETVIIFYFILNIINYIYIINIHSKQNETEMLEMQEIISNIKEYEAENNTEVNKVSCILVTREDTSKGFSGNIRSEVTRNALTCFYSYKGILNMYTGKKFEYVRVSKEMRERFIENEMNILIADDTIIFPIYSW